MPKKEGMTRGAILYQSKAAPPQSVFTKDYQIAWFQSLSLPQKLAKDRAVEFQAFTYGPTPIVNTTDQWWQNLATPPKAKPRSVEYRPFTYGPVPIVVPVEGWWQNLATPPKAKPRTAQYPAHIWGAFTPVPPETITVDKWFHPLSKPKKLSKDRVADFPAFTYGRPPIVQTADRWWRDFDPPPKAKRRTPDYPFAFVPPYQLTPGDHIGWFNGFTQPKRHKFGQDYYLQRDYFSVPAAEITVYAPFTMGYIIA